MAIPYIAQINTFGFNWAPKGWALCAGQLLPISQNTALFSLIGTTYGGDGRVTMGLPNTQSRTLVAQGQGPGLNRYEMGEMIGSENRTLLVSELPQHNHLINANIAGTSGTSPSGGYLGPSSGSDPGSGNPVTVQIYSPAANTTAQATGLTGGGVPFSILQPLNTASPCIALVGLYPSRN
ncbi:MAG: phage tail protein [Caulobacter sp.]|nr:phage tail protein [Caulobacter sp.]